MVVQYVPHQIGADMGVRKDITTKISKRVSWLNDKAGLKAQIRLHEVREALESIGDAAAMKVLKEVEEKSASLYDPTLYVKSAVTAQLTRLGGVPASQGSTPHGGLDPLSSFEFGSQATRPVQQLDETNSALYTDLWNRVEWMNSQGVLKKALNLDRVFEVLSALGQAGAHELLTRLESNASKVNDPTGWVITAAIKEQQGQRISLQQPQNGWSPAPVDAYGAPGWGAGDNWASLGDQQPGLGGGESLDVKLQQRISWLNDNTPLAAPLDGEKVISSLMSLGDHEAMRVLKTLETKADSVRDPTGWVLVAAGKRRQAMPPQVQASLGLNDGKLRTRIDWLNNHVPLATPLSYDSLAPVLSGLEGNGAMEILKKLEENAATVNDPNSYVQAAAKRRRLNGDGATPSFSSVSPPGALVPLRVPTVPFVYSAASSAASEKFRKKIGWLNHNGNLQAQLTWDEVSPFLLQIDADRGMDILKGLEDSAATVTNPNKYVITAAQNAMQESPAEVDMKIRRRIGWLNCNVQFSRPLMYNEVIGDLIPLGIPRAMVILKEVEEHAQDPNPSQWIIQKAREMRGVPAGAGSAKDGPPEERLSKRIAWLNDKGHLSSPVDTPMVMPLLLELDIRTAMQVLKRLEENADSIQDPTSYVQAEAAKEPRSSDQSTDLGTGESIGVSDSSEAWEAYDTSSLSPEDSLWYNVERLNGSRLLLAPLSYEQISPSLLAADRGQASRILNALEKDAAFIEDPNAYVIAEAQAVLWS